MSNKDIEFLKQGVLSSLNGSVQESGIRVNVDAWLNMGSSEWKEIDDKTRAYAYQAAKMHGWSEGALRDIVKTYCPDFKPDFVDYIFSHLNYLTETYPTKEIKKNDRKEN